MERRHRPTERQKGNVVRFPKSKHVFVDLVVTREGEGALWGQKVSEVKERSLLATTCSALPVFFIGSGCHPRTSSPLPVGLGPPERGLETPAC